MGKVSLKREKGRGHTDPAPVTYASRPLITPPGGDYTGLDPVAVTITTTEAGGSSFYTDDGTTPSGASTPYTVPIDVEPPVGEGADIQIRAITTVAGKSPSDIAGALYHFDAPVTPPAGSWDTRAMRALPTDGVFSTWAGPTSGAEYWISPTGNDSTGTGAYNAPWATFAPAITAMVPGDTLLLKGDGNPITHFWWEALTPIYLNWTKAGTLLDKITIASEPGTIGWIHGDYQIFFDDPANAWEGVVGSTIDEFQSVNTYLATGNVSMWFADSMVPIQPTNQACLEATEEFTGSSKDSPYYIGPCNRHEGGTGRFRVRLSHTTLDFLETNSKFGLVGDHNYTGEIDPRNLPLLVGRRQNNLRMVLASHVRLKDVVLSGFGDYFFENFGATGIEFDNVWVYPNVSGPRFNSCPQTYVHNSKLRCISAPWSSRASLKYQGPSPYNMILSNCPDSEVCYNEITDGHDLMRFEGTNAGNYSFHHNLLEHGNDDVLYMPGKATTGVRKIYQNILRGGVSFFPTTGGGVGVTENDSEVGTYIYRNMIDMRWGAQGGAPALGTDEMNLWYGGSTTPGTSGEMFMSHSDNYERSDVHFYHNDVLIYNRGDWYYRGMGTNLRQSETECYNNILIQTVGNVRESLRDPAPYTYTFGRGNNIAWSLEAPTSGTIPTEVYANPLFANYTADRFNPDQDLRVASNSPCLNGGRALDASWPDVDALTAEDSGLPDIGAIPVGFSTQNIFGPEAEV